MEKVGKIMSEEKKDLNKNEMTEEELNKIAGGKFTSDIFLPIKLSKYFICFELSNKFSLSC